MNDLQQLIESIYNSDKTLEQKVKARLNEIQKEMLLFLERKGRKMYPVPYDRYGFQREKDKMFITNVFIKLIKVSDGLEMVFIVNNGSYDELKIHYDEVIANESQINEKFDHWVIKQTINRLQDSFGKW